MKLKINYPNVGVTISINNGGEQMYDNTYHTLQRLEYVLEQYSPLLIASLKRRKEACINNLLSNIDKIVYSDNFRAEWGRGSFNLPSYDAMENLLQILENKRYSELRGYGLAADQLIKALLNDDVTLPEKINDARRSELISILCEIHAFSSNMGMDTHFDKPTGVSFDSTRKGSSL